MRIAKTLAAIALLLISGFAARASEIQIISGETRPILPADPVAVGYFVVTVSGRNGETLVSGSSPVAANVSVNETVNVGAATISRPVIGGVTVPANGTINFEPGGYHLSLSGLSSQINVGDIVPVTLNFSNGSSIGINLVASAGP